MLSKPILVEMTRFELATSTSRTWRSTKLSHISLMIFSLFSVSGQTCGQTTYIGVVIELIIAQKCSVFKGFRRFGKSRNRNRQFAPETGARPTALHLEMVKILDFFVSGQTCGQTEDLMIFRHSGEPKKVSVFKGFRLFSKNLRRAR